MEYKIIYRKRFLNKLLKLLDYLRDEWSRKVAEKFIFQLQKRLHTLSKHPLIGSPSTSVKSVRSLLITRRNRIFYRIKGSVIEVINMYDTRSDPKKNPYK